MDIGIVSIISSAVVALGSVGATVWSTIYNARKQREHDSELADKAADSERRLSYEGRAWDRKIEAHIDLIHILSTVERHLQSGDRGRTIEHLCMTTRSALANVEPAVSAWGNDSCRRDLKAMRALVEQIWDSCDKGIIRIAQGIQTTVKSARDAGNRVIAYEASEKMRHVLETLGEQEDFEPDKVQEVLDVLRESTRVSLRGDEDTELSKK